MKKRNILFYITLIFLVILSNFLIPRLMPGSPLKTIAGESVGELSEKEKQSVLEAYDFDKPLYYQFINYVKNFFTLNWGTSFSKNDKITTVLMRALPWTLLLSISNLIISSVLGSYLGYKSAIKRKEKKDLKYMFIMSAISSLPTFWVGMTFIAVFSVFFKWFPLGHAYSLWKNYKGIVYILDVIWHLTLPLLTLTISTLMSFFVAMRYGVLTVISEDYIKMAKLRNLPDKRIKFTYIIRNSIIPVFTVFMIEFGYILSGSVIIETIFSYPGVGNIMYNAVLSRDYPLVQYSFVTVSFMVIFANFLADKMYSKIDTKMEYKNEE